MYLVDVLALRPYICNSVLMSTNFLKAVEIFFNFNEKLKYRIFLSKLLKPVFDAGVFDPNFTPEKTGIKKNSTARYRQLKSL